MRVLFIVNTFMPGPGFVGGAEISAYRTCQGLLRLGIDCSFLVLNNRYGMSRDEWYNWDSIPIHRLFLKVRQRSAGRDVLDWHAVRAVVSELRRIKPDLVHVHNVSGATLAPFVACRLMRTPVVSTLHDHWLLCPNNMRRRTDGSFCDPAEQREPCGHCYRNLDYWGMIPRRTSWFAALTSNVQFFISPSQALVDLHVRAGYSPARFAVLKFGCEPFTPSNLWAAEPDPLLDPFRRQRTIVFAGGAIEPKGPQVLAAALPMLTRHIEGLHIVIAGTRDAALESMFLPHRSIVHLLGVVPFGAMACQYAAADLTVVPSTWYENSPLVIYESLQSGTPIVASSVGGIPELISDGETGYLFPVGDARTLAERIIMHFARPAQERRRMRRSCVRYARTQLAYQHHIAGVYQVYQTVLSKHAHDRH